MKTSIQSPPKGSPLNIFALILQLHFAVTLYLVGLIWIVQIVHYPLMKYVDPSRFVAFEKEHCQKIAPVVAPAMLLEGALSFLVCYQVFAEQVGFGAQVASAFGLILLGFIWLSTFAVQVPIHNRLAEGLNIDLIAKLVRTNWIRTAAWSLRGFAAGYLIWAYHLWAEGLKTP
jgi:hypothetical protein